MLQMLKKIHLYNFIWIILISFVASMPFLTGKIDITTLLFLGINFLTALLCYLSIYDIIQAEKISMLCTAFYTLSIYRIGLEASVASVSELAAYIFLPVMLNGLFFILSGQKVQGCIKLFVALLFCTICHMEVSLISIGMLLLLAIFYTMFSFKLTPLIYTFLSIVLTGACFLPIFYTFQAHYMPYVERMLLKASEPIQAKGLYLSHFFIHFWDYSKMPAMEEGRILFPQLSGLGMVPVIFCVGFLLYSLYQNSVSDFAKITLVVLPLLMFACLDIFPWDYLQNQNRLFALIAGCLEYPGRLLGWINILFCIILGYSLKEMKKYNQAGFNIGLSIAVLSLFSSNLYFIDSIVKNI